MNTFINKIVCCRDCSHKSEDGLCDMWYNHFKEFESFSGVPEFKIHIINAIDSKCKFIRVKN